MPGSDELPSSSNEDGFLDEVRRATRRHHQVLEDIVNLEEMTRSIEHYREILLAFYGLWKPLEDLLEQSPVAGDPQLGLKHRMRSHKLTADLRALEVQPSDLEIAPMSSPSFSVAAPETAAGLLYVLEGSTLGGQVIVKKLRGDLGLDPSRGASFFHGYGQSTTARWKEFCAWAEDHFTGERARLAAAAAVATFDLFIHWMSCSRSPLSPTPGVDHA